MLDSLNNNISDLKKINKDVNKKCHKLREFKSIKNNLNKSINFFSKNIDEIKTSLYNKSNPYEILDKKDTKKAN